MSTTTSSATGGRETSGRDRVPCADSRGADARLAMGVVCPPRRFPPIRGAAIVRALAMGFDAHVAKPISGAALAPLPLQRVGQLGHQRAVRTSVEEACRLRGEKAGCARRRGDRSARASRRGRQDDRAPGTTRRRRRWHRGTPRRRHRSRIRRGRRPPPAASRADDDGGCAT